MTEDEAKQRWCPFARCATGEGRVSFNRPIGEMVPVTENLCIASDCAVWVEDSPEHNPSRGMISETKKAQGHCGLAGK